MVKRLVECDADDCENQTLTESKEEVLYCPVCKSKRNKKRFL